MYRSKTYFMYNDVSLCMNINSITLFILSSRLLAYKSTRLSDTSFWIYSLEIYLKWYTAGYTCGSWSLDIQIKKGYDYNIITFVKYRLKLVTIWVKTYWMISQGRFLFVDKNPFSPFVVIIDRNQKRGSVLKINSFPLLTNRWFEIISHCFRVRFAAKRIGCLEKVYYLIRIFFFLL